MLRFYDPDYPHLIHDKDDLGNLFLDGEEIIQDTWVVDLVPYEEDLEND